MVTSFEIYLPPRWVRLDLHEEPEQAVEKLITRMARSAPPSKQPTVRDILRDRLAPRLLEAAERGVVCMLVPVGAWFEDGVRPIVSMRPIDLGSDGDPLLVLQAVAGTDPSARLVDLPGMVALRTEAEVDATDHVAEAQGAYDQLAAVVGEDAVRVVPAPGDEDLRLMASRIRYLAGVPGDLDKWIDIQFAVDHPSTAEGGQLAETTVELFDAMVETFRWVS